MREIYLDHAAATPLDPRVKRAMDPYWDVLYANPSSLHRPGRLAKDALDGARMTLARILNCRPEEIIFTAGGTEADNIAIFGAAGMLRDPRKPFGASTPLSIGAARGKHLITTSIEHHAGLRSFKELERESREVTYLPVDAEGLVDSKVLREAIRPDTLLVSVMYANNEIGAIQPIEEIGDVIRRVRKERAANQNQLPVYFHCDASQAAGFLDLDVQKLGVDLMSVNAGKIYGPKGAGALFVRNGVRLKPSLYGGDQEKGLRPGTENVPGIVGLAKAIEIADAERAGESARLEELRDYFIRRLTTEITKTILNGHPAKRLPNNVNVSILDIEGEAAVLYLDAKGVYASTGSACTSATLDPSHVILALGRPYEHAHGSLRFTLGRGTTKDDLDYVMEVLPGIVEKLRAISPIKMDEGKKEISHPEAFAGQGAKIKVGGRIFK